jgi:hypothetical protein
MCVALSLKPYLSLKKYPEKVIHMDIVVVDVPDVWGMLFSRKFASMLGGTLEMDLTYENIPLNNGTIGRVPNVPMTRTHVQENGNPIKDDKAHKKIMKSLPEFSPQDMPFAAKENFDQIQWPTREEYPQILDKYENKEVGAVKLLKKEESDILIQPSRQEVFTAESHPRPSTQYTRVVQGTTKFKIREYMEGDVVWMWDTEKGEPTNVKGSTQCWLRPFKVGRKSVNDS